MPKHNSLPPKITADNATIIHPTVRTLKTMCRNTHNNNHFFICYLPPPNPINSPTAEHDLCGHYHRQQQPSVPGMVYDPSDVLIF